VLRTAFATNFNFVNHGKNNLKAKLWNHTQNDTTKIGTKSRLLLCLSFQHQKTTFGRKPWIGWE
jgi:hypothetical protein